MDNHGSNHWGTVSTEQSFYSAADHEDSTGSQVLFGSRGGKLPPLNLDQVTTVQAMVADAEQFGGIDMRQISVAILQMRSPITPALMNMIHLLNYEKLAQEIRMEATADDTRSVAWLKQWLQKHDMQMRASKPIETARWRHGTSAVVIRWVETMNEIFQWAHPAINFSMWTR
jgi:hypothetical protein